MGYMNLSNSIHVRMNPYRILFWLLSALKGKLIITNGFFFFLYLLKQNDTVFYLVSICNQKLERGRVEVQQSKSEGSEDFMEAGIGQGGLFVPHVGCSLSSCTKYFLVLLIAQSLSLHFLKYFSYHGNDNVGVDGAI